MTWPWRDNTVGDNPVGFNQVLWSAAAAWASGSSLAAVGRTPISLSGGGTGVDIDPIMHRGLWCHRLVTTGAGIDEVYGRVPIAPPIQVPPAVVDAGAIVPEWQRAFWLELVIALDPTGTPGDETAFVLMAVEGAPGSALWPGDSDEDFNLGMFGFFGDGAGGLEFQAREAVTSGGATLTTVAVPAPVAAGAFRRLELFVTGAGPGRTAHVDVYADGVRIATGLEFTNAAGGLFWDPTVLDPSGFGSQMHTMYLHHEDTSGDPLFINKIRGRWGAFTRDGVPIP